MIVIIIIIFLNCPIFSSTLNANVYAILMQCSRIQNYSTIYLVKQHSTNVWGELP